jgi:hypothetical protein
LRGKKIRYILLKEYSSCFRDALVIANYHNKGQSDNYLKMFFENLLLGAKNELNNEKMYDETEKMITASHC